MKTEYKANRLRYLTILWISMTLGAVIGNIIAGQYFYIWPSICGMTIGTIIIGIFAPIHKLGITINNDGVQGPLPSRLRTRQLFASYDDIDITNCKKGVWQSYIGLKNGQRILVDSSALGRTAAKEIFRTIEKRVSQPSPPPYGSLAASSPSGEA